MSKKVKLMAKSSNEEDIKLKLSPKVEALAPDPDFSRPDDTTYIIECQVNINGEEVCKNFLSIFFDNFS